MAILRSVDGTFYDVPDDVAQKYVVPPEEVKSKMDAMGEQLPNGPTMNQGGQPGAGKGSPQIVVQFITKDAAPGPVGGQGMQQQAPQEETVDAQWWVNWYNWNNWSNWYNWY